MLVQSQQLEQYLLSTPPGAREVRLFQSQRLDFLARVEREIFLRNHLTSTAPSLCTSPVPLAHKLIGWLLLAGVVGVMAWCVVWFGTDREEEVTKSWLASVITAALYDPVLIGPALLVWNHRILPWYFERKVQAAVAEAGEAPIVFVTFIPAGPAYR